MVVLTVELRGMGIVQHIGDVVANLSSGLPWEPPRFWVLLGRHRISGESREGGVPVLTGELGGTDIIRTIGDMAAHLSSGLPQVPHPPLPLSGSRRRTAILRCRSVGCHSGWLVVVVRKLVTLCHGVCICKGRHMLQ